MRGVVKSFFSFSMAMTVFGMDQLGNLLRDEKKGSRKETIQDAVDSVSEAAEKKFSDRAGRLFESGDKLQGEMVDMVFDFFKADNIQPGKIMDRMADFADSSAEALRDASGTREKEEEKSG